MQNHFLDEMNVESLTAKIAGFRSLARSLVRVSVPVRTCGTQLYTSAGHVMGINDN